MSFFLFLQLVFSPIQMLIGAFLLFSLVTSLIAISLIMNFKVRRAYGGYLIAFYAVFLVIAILTETGIILNGIENVTYV